jgi:hypothetical protein
MEAVGVTATYLFTDHFDNNYYLPETFRSRSFSSSPLFLD